MPTTPAYLEFVLEHLAPLGAISNKRMFGGHCLYCDGTVFALVAEGMLYLKADSDSRAEFLALQLKQFNPFGDPEKAMNYFQPPPEFFEDHDALLRWGRLAIDAGKRGSRSRKSAKKKASIMRR